MFFFSFIRSRYWWPRHSYTLTKKFALHLLKDTNESRIFFIFKNRKRLSGVGNNSALPGLFCKSWVELIFRRNAQRRIPSLKFLNLKIKSLNKSKKKLAKIAKVWIRFSNNNMFFSISDSKNKLITYFSSGSVGFLGPTKTSSFALDQISDRIVLFFKQKKFKAVNLIFLSGMFNYRSKSVIDLILRKGLFVKSVTYRISLPHNGLRKRKAKRR